MVTRTVLGTEVTVKAIDPETEEIKEVQVLLSKRYTIDDPKLDKVVRKNLDKSLVLVSIKGVKEMNKLYGLDTSKFMELALELDPETRKVLKTGEDTENENEAQDEE